VDVLDGAGYPWATDAATADAVYALLDRPAWHHTAACREHPELSWFPGAYEDASAAVAVCAACPVAD
jgi:Transcription factor WhiB